jgi:hypothetical protein
MIGEIDPETEIAKLEYRLEKLSVLGKCEELTF